MNTTTKTHVKVRDRVAKGLCCRCSEPLGPAGTRTLCRACADRCKEKTGQWKEANKDLIARKKADGLCQGCWKDNKDDPSKTRCFECRQVAAARTNKIHQSWKDARVCTGCGNPEVIKPGLEPLCKECYLKLTAYGRLGSRARWVDLLGKWEDQGGICPYTGIEMTLGIDSTVDHILPVSLYPEHAQDVDNVEWVIAKVNEMKRDFTRDEFIEYVGMIAYTTSRPPPTE